jgi:molybdopterin synthase catalytic subunit
MIRSALVDRPIDAADLIAEVARNSNGATVLFVGTVRETNQGRAVTGMEYTAYRSMAECEMAEILREASQRFSTRDIVLEHRLGTLELGEASVAIAVAHPHRGLAYDASRYIIEQLKKRVPIWKLEHYIDGSRVWVGAGNAQPEPTTAHRPEFVTEERRVVHKAEVR